MAANPECLLADSRRTDYLDNGIRLYNAALVGNWKAAKEIHEKSPKYFDEKITKHGETALHIAAISKHTEFVSRMVPLMSIQSLALTNNLGSTALFFAVSSNAVEIARIMVRANEELPFIRNMCELTPLHVAALFGHRDMVKFLLECTLFNKIPLKCTKLSKHETGCIFVAIISTDLYDVALDLLGRNQDLAIARDATGKTPLHVLAKKTGQKSCGKTQSFWSKCLIRCTNSCDDENASHVKLELVRHLWERVLQETQDKLSELMGSPWRILFAAAEVGNVEFLTILIQRYPDLLWKLDDKKQTIFHVAVRFRQEEIFRLIFGIGAIKDLLANYVTEDTGDNILHLAALLPSSDRLNCVSGPALQMQREMLWFKAVESIIQPHLKEERNAGEEAKKKKTHKIEKHVTETRNNSEVGKGKQKALHITENSTKKENNNEEWKASTSKYLPTEEHEKEEVNNMEDELGKRGKGEGKTPRALFTEEHKELRKEGEEWMRKTAGSCSFVATLIASVVFGAALKVPGSQSGWHWFFAISDSLSLTFSTASILIFLSIMTSRYTEEDFLKSLPLKLMIGLTLLFMSIATMLAAFTATFHLLFNLGHLWVLPTVLSCMLILIWVILEFPLLMEVSRSTIGSDFIFKPRQQLFSSPSGIVQQAVARNFV